MVALNLATPGARATSGAIDLGTIGGTISSATAVSGDVVVGWSHIAGNGSTHAFAYDLGAATPAMQDLGTLGGPYSAAMDVSGEIVVGWSWLADGTQHAFGYDLGAATPAMQDLGTLGGSNSQALAVSGDIVVGNSSPPGDNTSHAFVYDLGAAIPTMQDLGTLGGGYSYAMAVSGDIVVGLSYTAAGERHAFAYDLGAETPTMQDLGTLGGTTSSATAVSGDIVVGPSRLPGTSNFHAFAYDLGAAAPMQDLGTLGGTTSVPRAVSGDIVVGQSWLPGNNAYHAFIYDLGAETPAMRDLGTLGGNLSSALAVDGDVVVGDSSGPSHAVAWILSPVTVTTTTLASSADPSIVGEEVTHTASSAPVPVGGTIAFKDGATVITGCESQSIDASGQATCQVTYTDVGTHSITAAYSGSARYAASTSAPLGQDVAYAIELLYDPTKAGKARSVVKLELQDAAQNNLSSSAITLTVDGLSPSPAPGTPPAGNFTFQASRKGASYQLLINTKTYPAGTYTLSFTAGADPTTHTASFAVK